MGTGGIWSRIAMIVVGVWLALSAFLWEHGPSDFTNTWLSGAAAAIVGLVSLVAPGARRFNTALAIWLLVSLLAVPTADGATLWNNGFCAVLLFALSLVPEKERHAGAFAHHHRVEA